ncbi:protein GRINL1A [Pristis pectinata]|uniref:protein GRINL1A n=1 Tax=Pristis pectinata TaxID=685728 RepID=UPI00223CAF0B|nr:protein GRINL1A [Pristis pectinata]
MWGGRQGRGSGGDLGDLGRGSGGELGDLGRGSGGELGDLGRRSRGELAELLRRQLKLQANKKFIQNLPDKGKRIDEFIQKLEAAIAHHEEVERTAELLSAVKLEFQMKQEMTLDKAETLTDESVTSAPTAGQAVRNKLVWNQHVLSEVDVKGGVKKESSEVCVENQKSSPERTTVLEREQAMVGSRTAKAPMKNENLFDSMVDNHGTMGIKQEENDRTNQHRATNVMKIDFDSTSDLLSDRFGRVSLTENKHRKVQRKVHEQPTAVDDVKFNDNPFWTLHHQVKKTPHYVDVLQHRAMNPVVKKAQFKTNHPMSGSPGSSPDRSPGRTELKLSPAERRLRNRKHLDEITAARLPPLYHSPAQLLSVEESAELQMSQKQKYESAQAKIAAEKLTQRLNIKTVNFDLKHEAPPVYQGYRDQGDSSSSEDDLT